MRRTALIHILALLAVAGGIAAQPVVPDAAAVRGITSSLPPPAPPPAAGAAAFATAANLANPSFVRALWVEAQSSALKSPDSVQKLVMDARAAGFDTLFVQVRRSGDALYRSQIVPADPGLPKDFDPLGFLIRQCRTGGRPLKVYGVLTMCRVWSNAEGTPPDNHVAKQHAEWLTRQPDGKAEFGAGAGELWLDPGVAEAQDYLALVAADLARHYDLDGIVLDRLRYPDTELRTGYSLRAISRFDAAMKRRDSPPPDDPEWVRWRRQQVTETLRKIRDAARAAKPNLAVAAAAVTHGAAPADLQEYIAQSQPYNRALADWVAWCTDGLVDAVVLQDFRPAETGGAEFEGWLGFAAQNKGRARLVVAVAGWLNPPDVAAAMMLYPVLNPAADGVALYSYENPSNNPAAAAEAFAAFQRVLDPAFVQPRAAAAALLVSGSPADFPARFSQLVQLATAAGTAPGAAAGGPPAPPPTAPPPAGAVTEMATIMPPAPAMPAAPVALQPTPVPAPAYPPTTAMVPAVPGASAAAAVVPGAPAPSLHPDAGLPSLSELNAARAGGVSGAARPPAVPGAMPRMAVNPDPLNAALQPGGAPPRPPGAQPGGPTVAVPGRSWESNWDGSPMPGITAEPYKFTAPSVLDPTPTGGGSASGMFRNPLEGVQPGEFAPHQGELSQDSMPYGQGLPPSAPAPPIPGLPPGTKAYIGMPVATATPLSGNYDVIRLTNGKIFEGRVLDQGANYHIQLPTGGSIRIPAARVESVQKPKK